MSRYGSTGVETFTGGRRNRGEHDLPIRRLGSEERPPSPGGPMPGTPTNTTSPKNVRNNASVRRTPDLSLISLRAGEPARSDEG
ncbi:hypothetical protein FAGKG844_1180003 [Frankia sp. AgKG'84/4]